MWKEAANWGGLALTMSGRFIGFSAKNMSRPMPGGVDFRRSFALLPLLRCCRRRCALGLTCPS
jgi:hypothetical protein